MIANPVGRDGAQAAFLLVQHADRGSCIPQRLTWSVAVRAGRAASKVTIR